MADALKKNTTRGRPRKYSNPESARLAKQKYDRERKQKLLQKQPTVESSGDDDNEPLIPSLQAIPLRPALKEASPPPSSSCINTFPQFASLKKTRSQAPSPKGASPPPSSFINTPPQFASPKKTPKETPLRQPSPKKTLPQAPSRKERLIEPPPPSPSNQLFDDWDNTIYNNDNDDDNDNNNDYSGYTDEGSGGGHIA